jgi:hypothetical protein
MEKTLEVIIPEFSPISLGEMDGVALMNRVDTKYMISKQELMIVLEEVKEQYRVLEVKGNRLNHYSSLYYDTPEFYFYRRHHSGKKNRLKIRKRSYVESQLTFLEVKFKSNKSRTEKERMKLREMNETLTEEQLEYILESSHFEESLIPQVENSFQRITLVDTGAPERITIDTDISFQFHKRKVHIPDLVIIEAKQERQNRHSPFLLALKKRMIRPESISKYCLGVALLTDQKSNGFKEKLRRINKITHGNYAFYHEPTC